MRQIVISAVVAAVVSAAVLLLGEALEPDESVGATTAAAPQPPAAAPQSPATPALSYTDELPEDTWINAARTAGADRRTLTDSANSICYITKIEIKGVQGPDDANACLIEVDDFTGFWSLVARVEEGGRSEVRCNARCLVWD